MKNIIISTLFLCLVISGCARLGNVGVEANDIPLQKEISDSDRIKVSDKTDLTKVDPKFPILLYGEINSRELESVGETIKHSNYGLLTANQLNQTGKSFEVDVLNCGGYLFSAVVTNFYDAESKEEAWEYRILPDSVAVDAKTKFEQCSNSKIDKADNYVSSGTLAIAPRDEKRRNIRTKAVDTRKLFASLPKDVRKWLDQDLKMPGQVANLDGLERQEKSNLSIKNGDDWIDFDGDGKTDFVNIAGINKEFLYRKGQNYSYNRIFLRDKKSWKEVDITEVPD